MPLTITRAIHRASPWKNTFQKDILTGNQSMKVIIAFIPPIRKKNTPSPITSPRICPTETKNKRMAAHTKNITNPRTEYTVPCKKYFNRTPKLILWIAGVGGSIWGSGNSSYPGSNKGSQPIHDKVPSGLLISLLFALTPHLWHFLLVNTFLLWVRKR